MSRWSPRRERFRAILSGKDCIYPGSVFDPISARIAEDLGFEAGMFAGSVASFTVLGAPDIVALTLSEFADQALRIGRAGELPLMVDADHGYGNAINVMRTVESLEFAGIAGLSIEDTQLPVGFGSAGKAQLTSVEEGIGKMRAALAARRDPSMVIAGRTSAPAITNVADALRRAKAYEAVGVDAIFLVGIRTRAELDLVAAEIKLPLILGAAGAELFDQSYLASRGVRICLQGHQPFMAAVQAVYDTLKALRAGTPPAQLERVAGNELMARVTRSDAYDKWMKTYL